jgi:quinol monooxygenase YgiN
VVRNVVMIALKPDADLDAVDEIQSRLIALDTPGCVAYTLGNDLGLRDGNWSFAIVADFEDEASYRAYDTDPEHNRLRGELASHIEHVSRVQFSV